MVRTNKCFKTLYELDMLALHCFPGSNRFMDKFDTKSLLCFSPITGLSNYLGPSPNIPTLPITDVKLENQNPATKY